MRGLKREARLRARWPAYPSIFIRCFLEADGLPGPATTNDCRSRRRGRFRSSLHLLVGVDAPQPLLLDPAIEAVAGDAAPACRAPLDLGHDAGLQAGRDRAGFVGAVVERREFVLGLHGDNSGAATGKQ